MMEKESMMRRILETAVILMGTLGFFGFVYPELCITDTVYETAEEEEASCRDVYDFLDGEGEIRIKFKAVEYLYQIKEKTDSKKEKNND